MTKSFISKYSNPYTLENLIENLDTRGLLVLQVLIGQQAMKELSKDKVKEVTKINPDTSLILPEGLKVDA